MLIEPAVQAVVINFSDVTSAHLAEKEVRQRLTELEMVNNVSKALRVGGSMEEMLSILLDETLTVLGASAGAIWLNDNTFNASRPALTRGWFDELGNRSIQGNESLMDTVFSTGEIMTSAEFANDMRISQRNREVMPVSPESVSKGSWSYTTANRIRRIRSGWSSLRRWPAKRQSR